MTTMLLSAKRPRSLTLETDIIAHLREQSNTRRRMTPVDESAPKSSCRALTPIEKVIRSSRSLRPKLKVNTSTRATRARLGRLPSLKQISERLVSMNNENNKIAAAALSDVTSSTNVPLARTVTPPSGSRLKLPPSAMSRVNIAPAHIKSDKDTVAVKEEAPVPEVRKSARMSLGVGRPSGPETPAKSAVPEVVVVKSTPEKAPEADKRVTTDKGEHPLSHRWNLHYDSKTYKPDTPAVPADGQLSPWEASLLKIGTFDTVEGFARHKNNIRLPSTIQKGANYHMFKHGIRPMWEDPANQFGGKWVMFTRGGALLDSAWANLSMALVGEMLDSEDKLCGLVVSARPRLDRIQLWTRDCHDVEYLNGLAKRMLDTLNLDPRDMENISLEFQPHSSSLKADPALMKISLPVIANRSVSMATVGGQALRRVPSSSGGSFPAPPANGLAVPVPMRRAGSAGANPFAGPLGATRRAVSTTVDGSA